VIALLHGAAAVGAVERYLAAVAIGLRERELPAVLLFPEVSDLELLHDVAGGSVTVETFPAELLHRGPQMVRHLAHSLRDHKVRVAHVAEVWPQASVAARLARVPRLLVTHHTPELNRNDNAAGRLWWTLGWASRPEVIYTSETDRRTDHRRALKTHVVPLGIDLERFRRPLRQLDLEHPTIGNVARLAPQKGQHTLLEAAPAVLTRHPTATFVFVGDGHIRGELEETARRLGISEHVTFTGEREDVPQLLASFDVFAFPSLFEGLCLAVIEAQAAGIPVVATPVGGIRETVVDGETGLLVPTESPDALAAAILEVLADPHAAHQRAHAAQDRVLEQFADSTMVERTITLYTASYSAR
jgi:glycosyltransferase involved in cell wall biosynthesis